jgi:hypothetical protein
MVIRAGSPSTVEASTAQARKLHAQTRGQWAEVSGLEVEKRRSMRQKGCHLEISKSLLDAS